MAEADPFPPQNAPAAQAAKEHVGETRSRRSRTILMVLGPVVVVAGALWYWFGNQGTVSTDNAYIKQDIVAVAGEVSGLITKVNVRENSTSRRATSCSRSTLPLSTPRSARPMRRSPRRRPRLPP
ncbi:hypothetical protein [Novosphingobium sp. CCH12-A3]|uniref:hypothetical protein n=1 Tax=Novosphingobium sp. CCH12-A3 TaxID=1768752 RepID=UPI000B1C69A5|nr:hypothetical protein [Novosphingobium sp. CCH12-A3]